MAGISQEQPPIEIDPRLAEWLARMVNSINAELERGQDLEPTGIFPEKIQDGMIRYFKEAIVGTDITGPGPWCVVDGTWMPMT